MKRLLYGVGTLIVVAVIFQLFFRYQYIHTVGIRITRIDRLTGASCELPCMPKVWDNPTAVGTGLINRGAVGHPTPRSAPGAIQRPRVVLCADLRADVRQYVQQCLPPGTVAIPPGAVAIPTMPPLPLGATTQ